MYSKLAVALSSKCSTTGWPKNQGFRYNQNPEAYMLVGGALGKGMLQLLKANR